MASDAPPLVQTAAAVLQTYPPQGGLRMLGEAAEGGRAKIERIIAEQLILDTLHYFSSDRLECVRRLGRGEASSTALHEVSGSLTYHFEFNLASGDSEDHDQDVSVPLCVSLLAALIITIHVFPALSFCDRTHQIVMRPRTAQNTCQLKHLSSL